MKRVKATWLLLGLVFSLLCGSPAFAIDPSEVMDGLKDKGFDALKDKAKDAGEDWIFDTGHSETMHSILDKAAEALDDSGQTTNGKCSGNIYGLASTALHDIGYSWTAKTVGKFAFDTLTKIGGLAAGGLGAAAEGGGLSWLAGQYADAAKGQAKDTAMDAIRKAFGKDKDPEFELYETSGKIGDGSCDYTLRAVWDIAGGTYTVVIQGNCHCSQVGGHPIGTWWVSFAGSMVLSLGSDQKTPKFIPQTPIIQWDALCQCGSTPLKPVYWGPKPKPPPPPPPPPPGKTATGAGIGTGTALTTPGGTSQPPPPPPPLPARGRTVCKECTDIQAQIDADWAALDSANSDFDQANNDYKSADTRFNDNTGRLKDKKADPSAFDISEADIQKKIDGASSDKADAKARADKASAEKARLENELRGLGEQLEKCIAKCGHASMNKEVKHSLIKFGLEKALDKRDKDDKQDDQNVKDDQHRDDDPYH